MLRKVSGALLALFLIAVSFNAFSQNNPAAGQRFYKADSSASGYRYKYRDSATLARWNARRDSVKAVKDSLKALGDSLSMVWIRPPDPNRPNRFADSLISLYLVKNLDFAAWSKKFPKKVNRFNEGKLHPQGERWVLAAVIALLLFFAVLKAAFSKEMVVIIQSFYSNRILGQISKEDRLFSSWPFIFLYILFSFTIGMFLYLCSKYLQLTYSYGGFRWFAILSLIVLALFTLKILALRILGFLFDVQRMVREYISILYLSYFNAAILYLPLVVAFTLAPLRYAPVFIYLAIALLLFIFLIQFLRAGANILSNYRFSKTYLFIYLCALEVCPILVLIKALRF